MTFNPHQNMPEPPWITSEGELHKLCEWTHTLWYQTWQTWFVKQKPLIDGLDGALSGDPSDPLLMYVRTVPPTVARNTIKPTVDILPLKIVQADSGSANMQEWHSSSGNNALIDGSAKLFAAGLDGLNSECTNIAEGTADSSAATVSQLPLQFASSTVPGGNTVANTAAETAFSSTFTLAANALVQGRAVRLVLAGVYGTALVAPTLRIRVKFGATAVVDTGVLAILTGSLANQGWRVDVTFTVPDDGAGGHVDSQGIFHLGTAVGTTVVGMLQNTAAIAIDTTTSQAITATITWGTANASNTITLRQMIGELLR